MLALFENLFFVDVRVNERQHNLTPLREVVGARIRLEVRGPINFKAIASSSLLLQQMECGQWRC